LTNEDVGNSTNEMPQSLFQLANHISPYRSNESVLVQFMFYHSLKPFPSSNQIQTLTFVFFQFENRHFRFSFHSDRTCLSCGLENVYTHKGKHLNPTMIF
jgi:hypothetical protein